MNIEEWESNGQYLTINGHRVYVQDTGPSDKPALVLLHGYPTSSHDFHVVLPALAEHYRVVLHDHIGFGLSAKPADYSYSLMEQADVALMVWRELGIKAARIVAHDYGTSVATEILARWVNGFRPIQLDSITLCNGSMHIEHAKLRVIQRLLRRGCQPHWARELRFVAGHSSVNQGRLSFHRDGGGDNRLGRAGWYESVARVLEEHGADVVAEAVNATGDRRGVHRELPSCGRIRAVSIDGEESFEVIPVHVCTYACISVFFNISLHKRSNNPDLGCFGLSHLSPG